MLPPLRESLLRPPSRVPAELVPLIEAQSEAKKRLVSCHRSFLREATQLSTQLLYASRRARAEAVRAEWDAETGKDIITLLNRDLDGIEPCSEAEVCALSSRLNRAMCRLYPEARTQGAFFLLFKHMDADGSGIVSFRELLSMVRLVLGISPDELSDLVLKKAWRWLDENATGTMCAGEFNRLMRKGWRSFEEERKRLERRGDRTPAWSPVAGAMPPESTWEQFKEDGAHLRVARQHAIDRTRRLEQEAKRIEQARRNARKRHDTLPQRPSLNTLPARPSTVGAIEGRCSHRVRTSSTGTGTKAQAARKAELELGQGRGSASAPLLS